MEIEVYENKVVEQITKGIDKENADKFMSILEQIRKNIVE